jgi:hypothetical protein
VFQASSAARIFWIAVSSVNGGSGGRASDIWTSWWSCGVPRERSGRRSHPQPTRSVADLLASFVAEASTEDSTATLIAKSLPVIHELGGTCVCVSLAITIQSRNVRDFSTSLAQVSRLRREGITTDKGAGR